MSLKCQPAYVLGLTSRCVSLFHWFARHILQQDYTVNHILKTSPVIFGLFVLSLLTILHLQIPCCISNRFWFVLYLISPSDTWRPITKRFNEGLKYSSLWSDQFFLLWAFWLIGPKPPFLFSFGAYFHYYSFSFPNSILLSLCNFIELN